MMVRRTSNHAVYRSRAPGWPKSEWGFWLQLSRFWGFRSQRCHEETRRHSSSEQLVLDEEEFPEGYWIPNWSNHIMFRKTAKCCPWGIFANVVSFSITLQSGTCRWIFQMSKQPQRTKPLNKGHTGNKVAETGSLHPGAHALPDA